MARTNKYASINFNHIYEKNVSSASSSSNNPTSKHQSYTTISSSSSSSPSNSANLFKDHFPSNRTHGGGRMLVLTRPSAPKSPSSPSPSAQTQPTHQHQPPSRDQTRPEPEPVPDNISLRPLGRTGVSSSISSPVPGQEKQREIQNIVGSPKQDKFVPPHLRPGFVGKEERPVQVHRPQQQQQQQQQQRVFWVSGSLWRRWAA